MAKKVSIEIELLDRISGCVDKINRSLAEMGRQGKSAQGSLNEIDGAAEKLKHTLAGLGVALSMK